MFIPIRESHPRSFVKALSWRVVGSLDTLLISYLITGNLLFAGSIASVETFTKLALYYVHERTWTSISWGRQSLPEGRFESARLALAGAIDRIRIAIRVASQPAVIAGFASICACFIVVLVPLVPLVDRDPLSRAAISGGTEPEPPIAVARIREVPEMVGGSAVEPPAQSLRPALADSASTPQPVRRAVPVQPEEIDAETPPRATYVGIWGAQTSACSAGHRRGFLPTVIDEDGAWAGETFCTFASKRRTEDGWSFVAHCSNARERWKANVRLAVNGNRLTWRSQRGSQTYVRCERALLAAQAL